jgi:hypothetical protein
VAGSCGAAWKFAGGAAAAREANSPAPSHKAPQRMQPQRQFILPAMRWIIMLSKTDQAIAPPPKASWND